MTSVLAPARKSPWISVLSGGLALGTLDLIFACTYWNLARDVAPIRILQSIAAGVQGKAAFDGGAASAMLGAVCHYFIATMMVLAYYLVSARWRALLQHPVRYGLLYGLLLFAVMTWIVVPLSNASPPKAISLPWVASSIVMHMVFGVICAWYARQARSG